MRGARLRSVRVRNATWDLPFRLGEKLVCAGTRWLRHGRVMTLRVPSPLPVGRI